MENDQGTRGLPASDGPLKGFLGGARRCAERATNLSAGQSGGSPSGELGRLKGVIARLETKSASFEGMWRRVLEFANKADGKAHRQDRRVEYLLTRSIQRSLENDKLQRDQEDMEGELPASRREIGALQTEVQARQTRPRSQFGRNRTSGQTAAAGVPHTIGCGGHLPCCWPSVAGRPTMNE